MSGREDNNRTLEVMMEAAEGMQNGIIWLRKDGGIISVNTRFAEDLGYASKADFEPKTIFEVNPSTSLLSWKRLWKRLCKEHHFSFDTEQITADEAIYPVTMQVVLLELGHQQICMAVVQNLMEINRYKDLLNLTSELASVGTWEWDLVKDKYFFNDQIYQLLHIPTTMEINKDSIIELIEKRLSEKEAIMLLDKLKQAITSGDAFEVELAVETNKDKYENFMLSALPVWLEDQTIKLYGTLQSLAKVEKRTDELYFTRFCMDHARDMIYWVEPNGNITYVNQITSERLGYTYEELTRMNIKDLSSAQTNIEPKSHWKKLKFNRQLDFETIHLSKDGHEVPVSISANYIHYKGKEFNCAFVRDLSSKKRRDLQIRLAKITLDQSNEMIFWLDKQGSFLYCNDSFIEKTGYERKEIEAMKIFDFFTDTNTEKFQEDWNELLEDRKQDSFERNLKLKDDSVIPCEMTITMIQYEGVEYTSNILRDIGDRKKREKRIKNQLNEIESLRAAAEAENLVLKEEINEEFNFNNIVSRDPNYKKVLRQVEQVADTDATVLILGETGTGKELLARAVHQLSEREDRPMIKVNCGSLPENLIESELFGHERGAFTGAHQRKIGKFERADKGTIFLDEIGELPLDLQSKLLRVLQEGEIERVGGTELINIDVRIIAATNRDLEALVANGKFREDLFYRLNVFPIVNIPLRERREDIPILMKYFVEKYSKKLNKEITEISQNGLNKLMAYDFLGNVRELENMVERSIILTRSKVLDFNTAIFKQNKSAANKSKFKTLEENQRAHIINALKITNGKVSGEDGAAALLDMNDKTLTSRLKKLGIDRKKYAK
jgi:PAS domain S-box-containing protein